MEGSSRGGPLDETSFDAPLNDPIRLRKIRSETGHALANRSSRWDPHEYMPELRDNTRRCSGAQRREDGGSRNRAPGTRVGMHNEVTEEQAPG